MNVVSLREYVFVIVASVVVSLALLAILFPRLRHPREMITIALTAALGILIWNTLLNVTNATFLNVDSPVLGLSAQDVGSGVGAFLVTALVLRFVTDRNATTGQTLAIAAIVGVVTLVVDLFG
jgi:uncharacterized membrane protein (UPF0136 family)